MGRDGWWLLATTVGLAAWFGLVLWISDLVVHAYTP